MFSLLFVFALINCNKPIVDKCEDKNGVTHDLTFSHHSSVKNSTYSTDTDPSNDLKDLDEGLHRESGEYALAIKVGLGNIQTIDVVADTGSSDLVLSNKSYRPNSSAANQNQSLSLSYGTCSGQATLYKDTIGLECGNPIEQSFAYLASSGSSCPNIMGLGYAPLAQTGSSFFDGLSSKNGLQNLFSMLLCGQAPGSQLVLGGHIKNAPIATMQLTPIVQESYYTVNAKSMSVKDGDDIGSLAEKLVIIDSGTTLSIVPTDIHKAIVSAILAKNPSIPANFFTSVKPSDEDYTLQADTFGDISQLPTITLTLAGKKDSSDIILEIPPQVYLKNMGHNNLIFGFREASDGETIIFGQTLMDNYYIVFDRENKQIGFAPNTGLCGN